MSYMIFRHKFYKKLQYEYQKILHLNSSYVKYKFAYKSNFWFCKMLLVSKQFKRGKLSISFGLLAWCFFFSAYFYLQTKKNYSRPLIRDNSEDLRVTLWILLNGYYRRHETDKSFIFEQLYLRIKFFINILSKCSVGHPIYHRVLKLNSKISAEKYKKN